jgi:VAD1 Analog of StAR-related lipid transfer domain
MLHFCLVKDLHLRCSLDEFYNLFLRDDASYSFNRYQTEKIRDRDVSITRWKNDEVEEITPDQIFIQSRVLSFTHPITNAVGLGPTEAKTTRRQLLRRYQDLGITIQNQTIVGGIPAADTFSVDDFWRIKSDGTDSVILSVNFEINFTKRTMFKNIIEKSVLRETRAWLLGYSAMTNEVLTKEKETRVASKAWPAIAPSDTTRVIAKDSTRIQMIILFTASLLIPCLVVVIVYVQILCKSAADIRNELLALRLLSKQILLRLESD